MRSFKSFPAAILAMTARSAIYATSRRASANDAKLPAAVPAQTQPDLPALKQVKELLQTFKDLLFPITAKQVSAFIRVQESFRTPVLRRIRVSFLVELPEEQYSADAFKMFAPRAGFGLGIAGAMAWNLAACECVCYFTFESFSFRVGRRTIQCGVEARRSGRPQSKLNGWWQGLRKLRRSLTLEGRGSARGE
jgi:hypothetical protein